MLRQTGVDLEAIVVDDCSSDETPERLASIQDPRVRVVRQEPNQGVARARNRGIEIASAPWIAFLDDDDFWAPTRLRDDLRLLEASGAAWAYRPAASVGPGGRVVDILDVPEPSELSTGLLEANIVGPPSTVIVPADPLRAIGGFDENLSVLADWDLWIRLARRHRAVASPDPLVAYCLHWENMQRTDRSGRASELEYLARKHRSLVPAERGFGESTFDRWAVGDDRLAGRRIRAGLGYIRLGAQQGSMKDALRGLALLVGNRFLLRLRRVHRRLTVPPPPWLEEASRWSMESPPEPPEPCRCEQGTDRAAERSSSGA